jgi:hypothetical protein
MRTCLSTVVIAASLGVWAPSVSTQPVNCAVLESDYYGECLNGARGRIDRAECAAMVEADLAGIDEAQRCLLDAMEQRHRLEREALLRQSALRRQILATRLRSNSVR